MGPRAGAASVAPSFIRRSRALLCSSSAVIVTACGGDATTRPEARPPVPLMVAVSDLSQQATVDQLVPSNPTIRVTDSLGKPQAGFGVQFTTGTQTSPMLVTGPDGLASVTWRLSQRAGEQTITAQLYTAGRVALPREITFLATALPDSLAAIVAYVGGNQSGFPSTAVLIPPIVVAVDKFSNAVAGVEVKFDVTGGGLVSPASTVTDIAGQARVATWTLGAGLGVDTLSASVGGGTVKPVVFAAAVTLPFAAKAIASGSHNTCAIAFSGDVYCWGTNQFGETHPGDPNPLFLAPTRVPLPAKMVSISGGNSHTCAISDEAPPQAYCWGQNNFGQLGNSAKSAGPVKVPVSDGLAVVSAGFDHTCGLTSAGAAYCWGSGTWGQLGDGVVSSCSVANSNGSLQDCHGPERVAGDIRFVSVAAGLSHTCGIATTGLMYCWGLNSTQQLGAPSGSPCQAYYDYYYYYYYGSYSVACALAPQLAPGLSFAAVAAGSATCGLSNSGAVICFEPAGNVLVTSGTFTSLVADGNCGIAANGATYCWTSTFDSQAASFSQPAPLQTGLAFSAITAAQAHRCGILQDGGVVMCWGNNDAGQLGNGTRVSGSVPSPVLGASVP